AAVDVQGLAGDVGGFVGGQVDGGGGDLVARAEAAGGDVLEDGLALLVVEHVGHRAGDEARGDAVDGDAAAADLLGQRLGEADHAGLGGGVVGLARVAGDADHRGDADDAAGAALHHPLHGGAAEAEIGFQIDLDDVGEVLVLHPHQQAVLGDAGVGDEDVQRGAGGLFGAGDQAVDGVGVRQVGGGGEGALAELLR